MNSKLRTWKLTITTCLHLLWKITVLLLDLDRIFENLPVKSLGSYVSTDREAMCCRKIPSWLWFWLVTSPSDPFFRDCPSLGLEEPLSALRLGVHLSSSTDMPVSSTTQDAGNKLAPRCQYSKQCPFQSWQKDATLFNIISNGKKKISWNALGTQPARESFFTVFFSFLSSFWYTVSSYGVFSLRWVHSIQRHWTHSLVVTDTKISWEFRFFSLGSLLYSLV